MKFEKLWMLGTSAMDPIMKVLWLERWNQPAKLRVQLRFPKPNFSDDTFLIWLHKATWWSQVHFKFSLPRSLSFLLVLPQFDISFLYHIVIISLHLSQMLQFLQLTMEAGVIFECIVRDQKVTIDYHPDGRDPIPTIYDYIEEMRISLWDTAFYREFAVDKGIHKNNTVDKQYLFKPALHRVLYRYFKYILFPAKAISRSPPLFVNYLDQESDEFMLTEGIMKQWDILHWDRCGWYLDCPLTKPPSFDITLRDSLEPSLIGTGTQKDTATPEKEAASTQKATATSKRGSKRKADAVESSAPAAAVPSTPTVANTAAPPPAQSRPPRVEIPAVTAAEPATKRVKLSNAGPSTPTVFLSPPKRAPMLSKPGVCVSEYTCLDLLVNDSFLRMADEKKKTGQFCPEYNQIVEFLKKVKTTSKFIWSTVCQLVLVSGL
jgi:hypothetical protein